MKGAPAFSLLQALHLDKDCVPCRASPDASHTLHATFPPPLELGWRSAWQELGPPPPA